MTTTDRFADGYEPDFDIDSEVGYQGQLFAAKVIDALKSGTSEAKNDMVALRSGNIYIECECLRRGKWQPSGIFTTKAEVWCHVIGSGMLIAVSTADMREIVTERAEKYGYTDAPRGSHPTRGILIPIPQLMAEVRYLLKKRELWNGS